MQVIQADQRVTYCPLQNSKITESTNAKYFENTDFGSTKVKETVFEEEKYTTIVPIVLNRNDVLLGQNLIVIPYDPIVKKHVEPNIDSFEKVTTY